MIRTVTLKEAIWNDLPYKFEAGTPAIAEAIAFGAAVDFLSELGMDAVHRHEQEMVSYALERLSELPGLHILGPRSEKRGGAIAFSLDGIHPHDVASILDEEGVCVRAGLHCAEPLHRRFKLPATVRASYYIYNTRADTDALVSGLQNVVKILRR
jgi:cysteine desulfurase/selenocysteine lyase